ncbi:MAG: DUF2141 domain-containing protein [Gammaproteobacteria bacterium]|nr:DUF2141 domain-containing protein [Gammaproteobacteria bacterium]
MLKRSTTVAVGALCSVLALSSQSAFSGELCISIGDIKSNEGTMMVAIVDNETSFKESKPSVASMLLPTHSEAISACVKSLVDGEYAIRVMQDLNNNGEMDTNLVGMPNEPWGTSNNATGSFGPPAWEDAKFELSAGGATQTITLNH